VSGIAAGAAGAKTLRAFIDRACASGETDETNNQTSKAYTVRATPTGPDLAVTSITLSPANVTAYAIFSATVTVRNQGTIDANGGWLDIWANQPAVQACGASGNTFRVVGTLAAGATASFSVSGLSAGAAGTKTLRAFVDSFCQQTEYDETNNQGTAAYTVSP
jgi:subtilase family serine protease